MLFNISYTYNIKNGSIRIDIVKVYKHKHVKILNIDRA